MVIALLMRNYLRISANFYEFIDRGKRRIVRELHKRNYKKKCLPQVVLSSFASEIFNVLYRVTYGAAMLLIFSLAPSLRGDVDEESNIRQIIEHYFEVWSLQDMRAYAACFSPDAIVTYVEPGGRLVALGRDRFVDTQVQAHKQSRVSMREEPEDIRILQDGDIATALVRWRLMKKSESTRGVDAFTLIKTPEGWRIIYLAFKTDS